MPPGIIQELWQIVPTVIYFFLGFALFGLSIKIIDRMLPFSIRKEIEEDQNVALGVILGSGLIALSIILAAVLK